MKYKIIIICTLLLISLNSLGWAEGYDGMKLDEQDVFTGQLAGAEGAVEQVELPTLGRPEAPSNKPQAEKSGYTVGVDDILEISVLQPEEILRVVNVAPDGSIAFQYIGSIQVKGLTIPEIQKKINYALADGYLKYPVVLVSLQESRSRKFFVYGEVIKPGSYPLVENTTVLRAVSMAGGFTRFGNSSRVKLLRPKKDAPGYDNIKVDIKKVMEGKSEADILLQSGDMLVISEGVF